MDQEHALYRWFRCGPHTLARTSVLNLALMALGFGLIIGAELIDGIIQLGIGAAVFFGFCIGVSLVAIANIVIDLTGPPA